MPQYFPTNIQKQKEKLNFRGLFAVGKKNIRNDQSFEFAELNDYSLSLTIGLASSDWQSRKSAYLYFSKFKSFVFISLLAPLYYGNESVRLVGLQKLKLLYDKQAIRPIIDSLMNHLIFEDGRYSSSFLIGGKEALEAVLKAKNDTAYTLKIS